MRFREITHFDVAPPFRAARAGPAKCGTGATPILLAMALAIALPASAQQKPFTRDQVQGLVRDGLGDESSAKLIEQRGIDFAPRGILDRARKW
jgi:hypothetical protein